jgi:IMP dehydrogenase
MRRALTFDDVALVPKYNNVDSRTEPELTTWLLKDIKVSCPIVPANMESVISKEMVPIIMGFGTMPIMHRFGSFEDMRDWNERWGNGVMLSWGTNEIPELIKFLDTCTAVPNICLDVAHGHSEAMERAIKELKDTIPGIKILAGNICTGQAAHDLCLWGADGVKVGIGPGAACTTRAVTGFGVPQFTAIRDCTAVANDLKVPIMADGGIRNSRDIVLALAAGASTVMIGKLFAATNESGAEKKGTSLGGYLFLNKAVYRGQASKSFQDDLRGGLTTGTVPEGEEMLLSITGGAAELMTELMGGIRSGLTYGGARSITELQRKAEFVEVTSTYGTESSVRR